MMALRRPEVVIDTTALVAALDPSDPGHAPVQSELMALLERAHRREVVLVSHSDAVLGAASLLAARDDASMHDRLRDLAAAFELETLHRDLLDDAEAVRLKAAEHGIRLQPAHAVTIELARRRGTTEVLSLDPTYGAVGLVVRPGPSPVRTT